MLQLKTRKADMVLHYYDDIGTKQLLKIVYAIKNSETENLHVFREKKAV